RRMVPAIKELQLDLEPQTIMSDFEKAAINVFEEVFPTAINTGCFFHFQQSIWRRIQQVEGLATMYRTGEEFALQIRKLPASAFVPQDEVIRAYEVLLDTPFFN